MDIIEGKGSSAFNRTAEFGASFGMGKAIDSEIPQQQLKNGLNAVLNFTETYVMPIFSDSWNKFNNPNR